LLILTELVGFYTLILGFFVCLFFYTQCWVKQPDSGY